MQSLLHAGFSGSTVIGGDHYISSNHLVPSLDDYCYIEVAKSQIDVTAEYRAGTRHTEAYGVCNFY